MSNLSPHDYGLPHDEWRAHQRETIETLLEDGHKSTRIVEAPTGSGKTSLAKAVSMEKSVMALCRTKNLQVENYGATYSFDTLFGRANYPCVHQDAMGGATAAECLYDTEGMNTCPVAKSCPYLVAKHRAQESSQASLNYAYWLTARWPRESPPEVLFLDEAHQLPDLTLEQAGISFTMKHKYEWDLPSFPVIRGRNSENPVALALTWLESARTVLRKAKASLADASGKLAKKARKCESLIRKIDATMDALNFHSEDWYIRSGPGAAGNEGAPLPGFIAKPLTARYHFPNYFLNGHETIMMSATIGDPDVFVQELGITDYEAMRISSVWPPETRPVHVLDVPRMGHKSGAGDYDVQALQIAKAIKALPHDWAGLVHVTRKMEAPLLATRLAKFGLQDRVWVPPELGSEEQAKAWIARRDSVKGSILIGWSFWEGWDGRDEKFSIVAKCPFPSLGDPFERERFDYSRRFYSQRTAWQLEQGIGRVRRGRGGGLDYDENGVMAKYTAIADGNWTRVKSYLSESFREALVK